MKKLISCLLIFAMVFCLAPAAFAAELETTIYWEDYSIEQLLDMQSSLTEVLAEKQRQYAIEHGDRKITAPENLSVYVGGSFEIEPVIEKVVDTAPDDTELIWTSSDDTIAKVSDGIIKGVSKGEAVITCTAADNEFIFAETKVQTIVPVSAVAINEEDTEALMYEGQDNGVQLSYTVSPKDAFCQDVAWESSDEEIAVVDESGYISLKNPGKVTITVRSLDEFSSSSPKTDKIYLSALQAASAIELDQTYAVINKGASITLKSAVLPENTSNKSVVWESSNPDVATVSSGQVRGVSCGNAVITCTAADGSGVQTGCEIEVIQMVNDIKLQDVSSKLTLDMNSSKQLTAEVYPDDATNKGITWTSSDESIVSVTEDGTITAVGGGTATISCTAIDGSEESVSVPVFVPSIAIEKDEYIVEAKEGLTFDAAFYGKPENFEISSSSSSYYSVSHTETDGIISIRINPIKAGKASITLKDKADSQNNRTISIVIEHSAVYDSTSYPKANYSELLRNPDKYQGQQFSIYGKVLQVMDFDFFGIKCTDVRIGTSGYGYYDEVYYVTIYPEALDTNLIEDDMVTIYGVSDGNYSYKAVMGNSITIPSMEADKVYFGSK